MNMTFAKSDSARIAKAGGGPMAVYRSEDVAAMASGSRLTLTLTRECSSLLLHNRTAYGGANLYFYFPDSLTPNTPVIVGPGENITIQKAWAESIEIVPDAASPLWQIVATL